MKSVQGVFVVATLSLLMVGCDVFPRVEVNCQVGQRTNNNGDPIKHCELNNVSSKALSGCIVVKLEPTGDSPATTQPMTSNPLCYKDLAPLAEARETRCLASGDSCKSHLAACAGRTCGPRAQLEQCAQVEGACTSDERCSVDPLSPNFGHCVGQNNAVGAACLQSAKACGQQIACCDSRIVADTTLKDAWREAVCAQNGSSICGEGLSCDTDPASATFGTCAGEGEGAGVSCLPLADACKAHKQCEADPNCTPHNNSSVVCAEAVQPACPTLYTCNQDHQNAKVFGSCTPEAQEITFAQDIRAACVTRVGERPTFTCRAYIEQQ